MSNISKMLVGAAGLAAVATMASPAAAQQPYPYGYPQQQNGIVGAIINSVTGGGYGQYPQGNYGYGQVNERAAVGQCAAAAEQRLNGAYRGQSRYGYGNQGYNGYPGQGYNNGYGQARVLGITNVERRGNGKLRVTGVASSGQGYAYGNQGYYGNNGYQGGYGANAQADLRFTCKVDYSGRVTDLKINRQSAYRGY
jgi:hypothetical protein